MEYRLGSCVPCGHSLLRAGTPCKDVPGDTGIIVCLVFSHRYCPVSLSFYFLSPSPSCFHSACFLSLLPKTSLPFSPLSTFRSQAQIYTSMHAHTHGYIQIDACTCTCTHIETDMHVHIQIYTFMHTHTQTDTFMHGHTHT